MISKHENELAPERYPPKKRRSLTRQPTIDPDAALAASNAAQAIQLEGIHFHDGTVLTRLAHEHIARFADLLSPSAATAGHRWSCHGTRTWGSLCSGSEGAHFVIKASEEAQNAKRTALGQPLVIWKQRFACESCDSKRKWIHRVVNEGRAESQWICIFKDIGQMQRPEAECVVHGRHCPVPDVDVLVVSTSCKDLSKLANLPRKFSTVLGQETSRGGSADTFRNGLLPYLDSHKAHILFYENSDEMAENQSQTDNNLDIFRSEMSARNYEGQDFILNSKLFGVPSNRRRFFGVYVSTLSDLIEFKQRTVFDQFATIANLLNLCRRQWPPLADVLLPCDSPLVQKDLEHRRAKSRQPSPPNWIVEHQRAYNKLGFRWGVPSPCAATRMSPWHETLTGAQQSILTFQQLRLLASSGGLAKLGGGRGDDLASSTTLGQEAIPRMMIDINPSISRQANSTFDDLTGREIAPCIVPKQLIWLHVPGREVPRVGREVPRVMLGAEAMLMQGWPVLQLLEGDVPLWVSDNLLYSLAGNCVSPPVLLALFLATVEGIFWIKPQQDHVDDENENQSSQNPVAFEAILRGLLDDT